MIDEAFKELYNLSSKLGEIITFFINQGNAFFNLPIIKKIEIIGIIVSIVLFVIWAILIKKTNKIKDQLEKYKFYQASINKSEKKHSLKIWQKIEKLIDSDKEDLMRQGFILMNELLDEVLNRVTIEGNNVIEKIKNLKIAEFNDSDKSKLLVGIYAYEKMRNNPSFNLESKEIKYFLKLYKQFFVVIGFLEK